MLNELFDETFVVEDFERAPYFKNESEEGRYVNLPYHRLTLKLIEEKNIQLVYVSGAKILIDKFRLLAKIRKKIPIVIEIPDLPLRRNNILSNILVKFIFRKVVKYLSSGIVVTSEAFLHSLNYKSKALVFYNYPNKTVAQSLLDVAATEREVSSPVIVFYGAIRYLQQIELLLMYAKRNPSVRVKIFGGPIQQLENISEIESYRHLSNIDINGPYNYEQDIINIMNDASVVYSVYDSKQVNVRLALPNKLYESVLSGKPLIVSDNTYLSNIVEKNRLGISVPSQVSNYDEFERKVSLLLGKISPIESKIRHDWFQESEQQKDNFIEFLKYYEKEHHA
ncbi:MAG: hypothetical protein HWE27_10770 [Gammaproteobacteria bacterium]|nr:hypothetical protein [Gammaproteobacteria bacterium]